MTPTEYIWSIDSDYYIIRVRRSVAQEFVDGVMSNSTKVINRSVAGMKTFITGPDIKNSKNIHFLIQRQGDGFQFFRRGDDIGNWLGVNIYDYTAVARKKKLSDLLTTN